MLKLRMYLFIFIVKIYYIFAWKIRQKFDKFSTVHWSATKKLTAKPNDGNGIFWFIRLIRAFSLPKFTNKFAIFIWCRMQAPKKLQSDLLSLDSYTSLNGNWKLLVVGTIILPAKHKSENIIILLSNGDYFCPVSLKKLKARKSYKNLVSSEAF